MFDCVSFFKHLSRYIDIILSIRWYFFFLVFSLMKWNEREFFAFGNGLEGKSYGKTSGINLAIGRRQSVIFSEESEKIVTEIGHMEWLTTTVTPKVLRYSVCYLSYRSELVFFSFGICTCPPLIGQVTSWSEVYWMDGNVTKNVFPCKTYMGIICRKMLFEDKTLFTITTTSSSSSLLLSFVFVVFILGRQY